MMMSILALATALASVLLMMGGLRLIAQDTLQVLTGVAQRAHASGQLPARAAFVALWVLIFSLSFL